MIGIGSFLYNSNQKLSADSQVMSNQIEILKNELYSSGKIIPDETVAFYNLKVCPTGWAPFSKGDGRFIISLNQHNEDLSAYNLGDTGGAEKHQLTKQELPRHTHVYNDWYYEDRGQDPEFATGEGDDVGIRFDQKRRTEAEGNNAPHNNMPPYIALLQCVKTKA